MKNVNKYVKIGSVVAGVIMVIVVFNIAMSVNAQMNTDDNAMMDSQDQVKIQNIKDGMGDIMDKYGMVQSPPDISRADWIAMHGEIYDLMKENGINPGTAMMYMFGGGMHRGNMMMDDNDW